MCFGGCQSGWFAAVCEYSSVVVDAVVVCGVLSPAVCSRRRPRQCLHSASFRFASGWVLRRTALLPRVCLMADASGVRSTFRVLLGAADRLYKGIWVSCDFFSSIYLRKQSCVVYLHLRTCPSMLMLLGCTQMLLFRCPLYLRGGRTSRFSVFSRGTFFVFICTRGERRHARRASLKPFVL